MEKTVVRTLSYYRKDTDSPSGEYPLTGIEVENLRSLFGADPENPMYDVYPVGPEQIPYLQTALRRELDPELYDYYLECHTP